MTKQNDILGLKIIENFITELEEEFLLEQIDKSLWLNDLKRRVQHYGYKYDYTRKSSSTEDFLGPMPVWLDILSSKIVENSLMPSPEQIIINEYNRGQGIGMHIDRIDSFGPVVISLSLLSDCDMKFQYFDKKEVVVLPRRSITILENESRYKWAHGISPIKADRRVSVTFRTMNKK
jgi:alkylated DNA repair dioxygenase AlkB